MDRLEGAARLMIVSDLDSTMVDHLDPENLSLLRFNALWEAFYRDNSLLVYSTGRSPTSYKQLKIKKPLLTPDVTIMSVGTEIMYGESMVPDAEWECYLNQKWNRDIVTGETAKFPELTPQVSNAQEELLEWYSENAKNNHQITHATERCAAGIIQAIGTFSLGPNVSPRDIRDSLKCTVEICNPGHEVVKFYLFYERWRRGEVERSDHFINNLRLLFNSMGTFVHPSGIEIPFSQCIDELANSYGDQLGMQFRVWVDRVSVAQICSDTWLVKFDKCELCGKDRERRVTTVLLSSRHAELPREFMWIYMHQTWLDGLFSGGEDQRPWLF
ncbi:hypothetical protein BT93_L1889 [Corymbia citriodora subsp. variegata]|nr:hypothetical protein BT93_L1889 [Corymbia citriodora subsp. variegata]